MDLSNTFIILSVIFYIFGVIPYFYHIFRARVVPHPFSWTVWFVFSAMNAYILYKNDGFSVLHILIFVRTLTLLIGAIIGWYSISKISISKLDILTLIGAISMIFVAQFLGLNKVVIFMIMIDLLVLFPTLKKIWIDPRSEDSIIWVTSSISLLFFVLSFPTLSFTNTGFWIYAFLMNFFVAFFIYRRSLYLSNWRNFFKKYLNYIAIKMKLW